MANSKVNVTNNGEGQRGVQTVKGLVFCEPGETLEGLEMTDGDLKAAKLNDDLDFGKGSAAKASPTAPKTETGDALADAGNNIAKLRQIAKAEDVDLTGLRKAAPIREAIEAARKTKADAGGDGDGLDDMDDATLRSTVQALTGEEPAADASREDLLALARKSD